MKKFFADFKKFISRGNIMDLAVGVIVGGAFTAIVTALTNKIIRPLVNWIIALVGGKEGLASAYTFLSKTYQTDATGAYILDEAGNKIVDLTNSIYIDWGAFLTAILDFMIIAFTIFVILKLLMKSREIAKETSDKAKKAHLNKAERKELKEAGVNIKDKDAVKAYFAQKEEQAKLELEKAEQEAKLAEEEAKKHTTEALLEDIKSLLEKQLNK